VVCFGMFANVARRFILLAPLLWIAGCASWKIHVPQYVVPESAESHCFVAGAAKVEITPPPGFPLGGHSVGGKVSRGYWTRLYARAFFFRDERGQILALVSCDLFAIPAGLHARVASLLAQKQLSISPESLILAATHTHHGPGNYMSSAVYNFGGPLPGFNPQMFETLAERIVDAIASAERDASGSNPSSVHGIRLRTGYALNIQRNRALAPFLRNPPEETGPIVKRSRDAGMICPDDYGQDCSRYLAVDPTLKVLEVTRDGRPIALLVFFAVHPTAMTHDSALYSADLTGRAMTLLETGQGSPLVAGFFNGAEGDVSSRWKGQNRFDVMQFGSELARAVHDLLCSPARVEEHPQIFAARREFRSNPARDPETSAFSARPQVGVGAFGGAEDGRTIFYNYGWNAGVVRDSGGDVKIPALDRHNLGLLRVLKPFIDSAGSYPAKFPVSVAYLGSELSIAAIPVEMTTVMGERLRQNLRKALNREFVIVGLANEYLGYTTTPEEYAAQNYEGASTIFGPNEGPAISKMLIAVAGSGVPSRTVPAITFNAGPKSPKFNFGPELLRERRNTIDEDLEPLMPDSRWRVDDGAPRFAWKEKPGKDWDTRDRKVSILRRQGDRWVYADNDLGFNLLTVLALGTASAREWTAIWLPPDHADPEARYLFHVRTPHGDLFCSAPFSPRPRDTAIRSGDCPQESVP
jgi:neutral ceramidase